MNAIEKIHSLDAFGSRPGLDRIQRFLDILGNPQDKLKFIHVAGTNGKGSTCRILSSVLVDAGYKTGLFISPYIVDFRERIQINNEMISEEVLEDAVARTFPILEKLRAEDCVITEFEYVTALEFLIHAEAECDVVVLETGMGGLLDCTNVIEPPLCSVITTIGIDHTAVLGSTITEISEQKVAVEGAERSLYGTKLSYNGLELFLPLVGDHQIENAKTALAALEVVKRSFDISDENLVNGFKYTTNPARFEPLSDNPTVILDGAHNPNGVEALVNAVKRYIGTDGILILGMLADKDSLTSVKLLREVFDTVYTVPVNNPRALSGAQLGEKCRVFFPEVKVFDSAFDAFDEALDRAKTENRPVVIAGSLYLAGEIRPYIISKT